MGFAYLETQTNSSFTPLLRPSSGTATNGDVCSLTAIGQDLFVTAYLLPLDYLEDTPANSHSNFDLPNENLANIVGRDSQTGIRGLINSGFTLLNMMLMIMAVIFFVTIIIILYKVFQYFATRPKIIE